MKCGLCCGWDWKWPGVVWVWIAHERKLVNRRVEKVGWGQNVKVLEEDVNAVLLGMRSPVSTFRPYRFLVPLNFQHLSCFRSLSFCQPFSASNTLFSLWLQLFTQLPFRFQSYIPLPNITEVCPPLFSYYKPTLHFVVLYLALSMVEGCVCLPHLPLAVQRAVAVSVVRQGISTDQLSICLMTGAHLVSAAWMIDWWKFWFKEVASLAVYLF